MWRKITVETETKNEKENEKENVTENKTENKTEMSGKSENKGILLKIYAVTVTIIAGVAMVTGIYFFRKATREEKEVIKLVHIDKDNGNVNSDDDDNNDDIRVRETVKDYMQNGKGVMAMLRELYPDNVIVYDSVTPNKYLFLPIIEGVKKNDIDNNNLKVLDNGEIQYIVDDKVKSHKGIDVSKYQKEINWQQVAQEGVEFAMIRIGYRGYGTGVIVLDEQAVKNIEGAKAAGIDVGVYFFSQAVTEQEAVEEARFVIDNIRKYDIKYPIVFDTEEIINDEARTKDLSVDELTDITIAFCEEVEKQGYTPAVYANLKWFTLYLDISRLDKYHKWYAYYDNSLYFPYKISMWQYSESGSVNGIEGSVDMNISFEDWE